MQEFLVSMTYLPFWEELKQISCKKASYPMTWRYAIVHTRFLRADVDCAFFLHECLWCCRYCHLGGGSWIFSRRSFQWFWNFLFSSAICQNWTNSQISIFVHDQGVKFTVTIEYLVRYPTNRKASICHQGWRFYCPKLTFVWFDEVKILSLSLRYEIIFINFAMRNAIST